MNWKVRSLAVTPLSCPLLFSLPSFTNWNEFEGLSASSATHLKRRCSRGEGSGKAGGLPWRLRPWGIRLPRGRPEFSPGAGTIPWRRAWPPTPAFFLENPHGQRSLAGFGPWGHKESDTTEQPSTQAITRPGGQYFTAATAWPLCGQHFTGPQGEYAQYTFPILWILLTIKILTWELNTDHIQMNI